MTTVFPVLDYEKIQVRYSKAVIKIEEWLFQQEELRNIEPDMVGVGTVEEAKAQFTATLIQLDPRKLYDIFDALGIKISIMYNKESNMWTHYNSRKDYSYTANSRIEAEQTAFEDAFEELEKSL